MLIYEQITIKVFQKNHLSNKMGNKSSDFKGVTSNNSQPNQHQKQPHHHQEQINQCQEQNNPHVVVLQEIEENLQKMKKYVSQLENVQSMNRNDVSKLLFDIRLLDKDISQLNDKRSHHLQDLMAPTSK